MDLKTTLNRDTSHCSDVLLRACLKNDRVNWVNCYIITKTNMDLSQIKNCNVSPLQGFKNIYSLNGYTLPTDKDVFHKYLPLTYLTGDINNKTITFVSPTKWSDSFETRYYQLKNYNKKIGFNEPCIFCMCLTSKQSTNEDAMWRVYAKPHEEMVKANINIKNLLKILDSQSIEQNFKVYIGEVIYTNKKDILEITPKKNKVFFSNNFGTANYLSLMSLKRCAYNYENEIRIFIVFDNENNEYTYPLKHNGNIPYIDKVTISPYSKIKSNIKPVSSRTISRRQSKTQREIPNITVERSRLFEKCPKCRL